MSELNDLSEKIICQGSRITGDYDDETSYDELMEILLNSREQGQMMEQLIKSQIQLKDGLIDKLHKELEYYKQGSADKFVDQVMKSIIKVRKDMAKQISMDEFLTISAEELRKEYTYIFEDLTDLLEQQNIDTYSTERGAVFNASIHQPKLEITNNPDLDKKIKASVVEGYKKGDKVLMLEKVIVYQFKA